MIKLCSKTIRICAIILVFMLTIEFCARIDDVLRFSMPFWQTSKADNLRTKDKDGLQINTPNARFEKWHNNSLGFRGPEISHIKVPGVSRIVCLGASESYGLYESIDKEWPAQLSSMLPSNKYQVINASVAGLSLCSYKAYLKKYVLQLKPDIIICYVNPFFYASIFERSQKSNELQRTSVVKIEKKTTIKLASSIISNLRFIPKLKQVIKNAMQSDFPDLVQHYQLITTKKQIEAEESERLGGQIPKDAISNACIKGYKNDLLDIVDFMESHGIKIVLCTYPSLLNHKNLAATYPVVYLSTRRFFVEYSFKGMVDVLMQLNKVTTNVAREKGTTFIDCQALIPSSLEYYGDTVHYTDQGAHLIANGIAQLIQTQDIGLKASSASSEGM